MTAPADDVEARLLDKRGDRKSHTREEKRVHNVFATWNGKSEWAAWELGMDHWNWIKALRVVLPLGVIKSYSHG